MELDAEPEAELDDDDLEPELVHPAATGIIAAPATVFSTDLRRIPVPFSSCRRKMIRFIRTIPHDAQSA